MIQKRWDLLYTAIWIRDQIASDSSCDWNCDLTCDLGRCTARFECCAQAQTLHAFKLSTRGSIRQAPNIISWVLSWPARAVGSVIGDHYCDQ